MYNSTRRTFLRTAGVATVVGVAGCSGNGGDGNGGTVPGDEYPAIDEWLTESEVGGATDNYDGTVLDLTGRESATVDVGAEGNGGSFAFDPPAVLVSTGTTVRWAWTGEGNPHNVVARPDQQLGESDFAFSSGEAVGGSGVQYTRAMDDQGIALYHCEPHLALGMKGGVAVE